MWVTWPEDLYWRTLILPQNCACEIFMVCWKWRWSLFKPSLQRDTHHSKRNKSELERSSCWNSNIKHPFSWQRQFLLDTEANKRYSVKLEQSHCVFWIKFDFTYQTTEAEEKSQKYSQGMFQLLAKVIPQQLLFLFVQAKWVNNLSCQCYCTLQPPRKSPQQSDSNFIEELSEYSFNCMYKKGKDMHGADHPAALLFVVSWIYLAGLPMQINPQQNVCPCWDNIHSDF